MEAVFLNLAGVVLAGVFFETVLFSLFGMSNISSLLKGIFYTANRLFFNILGKAALGDFGLKNKIEYKLLFKQRKSLKVFGYLSFKKKNKK